jgi:hypothetical protein
MACVLSSVIRILAGRSDAAGSAKGVLVKKYYQQQQLLHKQREI